MNLGVLKTLLLLLHQLHGLVVGAQKECAPLTLMFSFKALISELFLWVKFFDGFYFSGLICKIFSFFYFFFTFDLFPKILT